MISKLLLSLIIFLLASFAVASSRADKPTDLPEQLDFFEAKIRPLLIAHCIECHGANKAENGLRLDSRAAILSGGDSERPAAIPGDDANSLLMQSIRHTGDYEMPPAGPLDSQQIEDLANWIRIGLPWPESAPMISKTSIPEMIQAHRSTHWAFQPIELEVENSINAKTGLADHHENQQALASATASAQQLDQIVAKKLHSVGLDFSPTADERTLIRRAMFDLTGLPPSFEQVQSFANNSDPIAYEKLIDQLLTSPQYGERWARHWLDVARYADTSGYTLKNKDRNLRFAFTYRDYVIDAFNNDLPYDQFIREQLAADYLPVPDDRSTLAALGFLTVGRQYLGRPDTIDDQLDVVTRGLMGLTVTCARCHDHKYDAIPIEDYYSLYGVFQNCHHATDLPLLGDSKSREPFEAYFAELDLRHAALKEFETQFAEELKQNRNKWIEDLFDEAEKQQFHELKEAIKAYDAKRPTGIRRAMTIRENKTVYNPRVMLRGDIDTRGAEVPRQFVALLAPNDRQAFTQRAGRLELANAIASPNNPLTARVIVNRVWMHHFTKPLVATPSDFGIRCPEPRQLELLNFLAADFIRHGWSLKHLHRTIMLSRTYQQTSLDSSPQLERAIQLDSGNELLWRMNRRRLEWESLRDSMLAVSGRLDLALHGPAVDMFRSERSNRRSIYGKIDRQDLPNILRVFDIASPDQSSPQRTRTVIPQQSLFLINNPFVIQQSRRVSRLVNKEDAKLERITRLYQTIFQRSPTAEEVAIAVEFVNTENLSNEVTQGSTATNDAEPRREPFDRWEQLAQAMLCSLEFEFID